MFQKNAYVFYGSGGICLVSDVKAAPLEGMPADRLYYVLKSLHDDNGMMYVPVDSDKVFLRPILTREEAEALLSSFEEIAPIAFADAKQLRAAYAAAMAEHIPAAWIRVIKTVRLRTREDPARRLSETERNTGENAKSFLCGELSLAFGCTVAEVRARVEALL